jgi:hypothetical protein
MLLSEFKNAFLFGNRHLLFVECRNPTETTPLLNSATESTPKKPEDGLIAKEVQQA